MAKIARRKKRRRRRDNRIPLALTMSAIGTFTSPGPSGRSLLQSAMSGNIEDVLYDAREKFAGIDNQGKFQPMWVINTYTPLIMGALVSKYAGKFVNKHMRKIPFIGNYVKA